MVISLPSSDVSVFKTQFPIRPRGSITRLGLFICLNPAYGSHARGAMSLLVMQQLNGVLVRYTTCPRRLFYSATTLLTGDSSNGVFHHFVGPLLPFRSKPSWLARLFRLLDQLGLFTHRLVSLPTLLLPSGTFGCSHHTWITPR